MCGLFIVCLLPVVCGVFYCILPVALSRRVGREASRVATASRDEGVDYPYIYLLDRVTPSQSQGEEKGKKFFFWFHDLEI